MENEKLWEIGGTLVGISTSIAILLQIIYLFHTRDSSSFSLAYLSIFILIFGFWTAYGFRFKRIAVWLTNVIALCLQAVLLITYFMFL
jgi:uncharacterized protein with PQ loop repeat